MTVKSSLTMLRRAAFYGGAALSAIALSACAIEVGPPPESDPPLVPQAQKAPPPPTQPTEPQPWSRDLDFSSGPVLSDSNELQDGLVAANAEGVTYSKQRLTYQSAFEDEKPVSEAEQVRQRARERAAAAGLPPPPAVSAAPVQSVSAEALPPAGGEQRESRLPPPPKFPPVAPQSQEAAAVPAEAAPVAEPAAQPAADSAAAEDPRWETSRLPPPPKFPTTLKETPAAAESESLPEGAAQDGPAAAPQPEATQDVAALAEPQSLPPETAPDPAPQVAAAPAGEAADFVAEAWNAPPGTILVQVSAVQNKASVVGEWQRLRGRFPEYLSPLRLVIDEAKLGDKGVFYRVQAGAFGSQAGASEVCDGLISRGQACFVVVR